MSSELRRLRKCFQPRQWFRADGEPDPSILNEEDSFMWVYRECKDSHNEVRFQVGYFLPDGTWFTESMQDTKELASARVNYLNGGR